MPLSQLLNLHSASRTATPRAITLMVKAGPAPSPSESVARSVEGRAAPGYVDALDAALLGLIIPIFAQEQDQVTLRFLSYSKSANPELVELLIGEDATIEVQARSLRMHTIHDCLP